MFFKTLYFIYYYFFGKILKIWEICEYSIKIWDENMGKMGVGGTLKNRKNFTFFLTFKPICLYDLLERPCNHTELYLF